VEDEMERPIHETLRQDHARLRTVLERVDALLRRRARGIPPDPPDAMRALALEFAARLGTHLTAEADAESLLLGVLEANASSRGAVTTLRGEHGELRSMLGTLVRTLDGAAGARRDEQIAVQLRDLVDLVRIHVRKEDVLILAAAQATAQPLPRRKGNIS
jgi:hemerythrin-like domain-containing protein